MKNPNEEFSDEENLAALRSDNSIQIDKALERLYIQNFPVIKNLINKNSGNDEDAADIFQNTMVAFYKKVRTADFELNCSIQTYLYSIARNLWLDQLRAQKKQQQLVTNLKAVEVNVEYFNQADTDDRVALIIKLMDQLGENCKKLLGLYYFDRLRMKKIAVEMGYANEQVAKNKKARCMKKLKSLANEKAS